MSLEAKNFEVSPMGPTYGAGIGLSGVLHKAHVIADVTPSQFEAAGALDAYYQRLPVNTLIDAVLSAGGTPIRKAYVVRASSSSGVQISELSTGDAGSASLFQQAAPAAKTVSATLTAAELLGGLITGDQGAAGAAAYTLPLAADLDAALPGSVANDAFDFFVINLGNDAAEDITMTTNTGWTLVGDMVVKDAASAGGSSGHFRARKTGAGAWSLYRLA